MNQHPLPRLVLRAVHALQERGVSPSIEAVVAVVPADDEAVRAMIDALDRDGYLDASRMRLTLRGFAAVQLPTAVAYERRQNLRLRKCFRVA
jgi:hypothetical protein